MASSGSVASAGACWGLHVSQHFGWVFAERDRQQAALYRGHLCQPRFLPAGAQLLRQLVQQPAGLF
jgi:hypothetical protein